MLGGILAWVDRVFVCPGLSPESARQGRLAALLLLANIGATILAVAMVPELRQGAVVPKAVAVALVSRLVLLGALRWTTWTRPVSHLFMVSFLGLIGVVGVLGGGAGSPVLVVVPLVPPLATLLLSVRGGAVWTVLCAFTTAWLTWGDFTSAQMWLQQGGALPTWMSHGAPDLAQFRGVAAIASGSMGFLVAAMYEVDRLSRLAAVQRATERAVVAREEAVAANAARARFLANMSHELRTPMSGVVSVGDLLVQTPLNDEQKKLVSLLMASGRGMEALLNDVLDMSHLESGTLALRRAPVNLVSIAADVVLALGRKPESVAMVLHAPPALWGHGDGLRIRQILTNLVSNAVRFTEAGTVTVRLQRTSGDIVVAEVEDTGIGMTDAVLRRVVEPFRQADDSPTRSVGGTGLGLAIVHHLAQAMQGELDLQSRLGEGTLARVRFQFPALAEPTPAAAGEAPAMRVLVVEDDPVSRQVARLLLERLGALVSTAENGAEAVERASSESFELVLMDVHMPVMDGLAATRALRAMGQVDLPIVALTAGGFAEDMAACLAAGMNDHIAKPARLETLQAVLAQVGARRPALPFSTPTG